MKKPFLACAIALTLLTGLAVAQVTKSKAPDNASPIGH